MSMDILGIGANAINAFQLGASVASKNIANSADPNYSREMVEYSTLADGGLNVFVKRISDDFLSSHLNSAQSAYGQTDISASLSSSIDQFITGLNGSDKNGPYNVLNRQMQDFFDSISSLSGNNTSPGREAFISNGRMLSDSINSISNFMQTQMSNADSKITDTVHQINQLTKQIAKVNETVAKNGAYNNPDLEDEKDKLINQLSQYVHVTTKSVNGQTNVYLANGEQLVAGAHTTQLSAEKDSYNNTLQIKVDGEKISNTNLLSGRLGGLIDTRNNFMIKTEQKIGHIAAVLTAEYNQQNRAGYTSSGAKGGDLFAPMHFDSQPSRFNQGNASITATLDSANISKLKDTNYKISMTKDGKYQVEDTSSGKKTIYNQVPIEIDGLKIDVSGTMSPGDSFQMNPMLQASSQIKMIAKESDVAVSDNSNGTGTDNINKLVNIATKKIVNGDETISDALSDSYAYIGSAAKSANSDHDAANIAVRQALHDKESVSGVNAQEEYTNLIHFQQSYAAASKIISTDQKLFGDLMNSLGE